MAPNDLTCCTHSFSIKFHTYFSFCSQMWVPLLPLSHVWQRTLSVAAAHPGYQWTHYIPGGWGHTEEKKIKHLWYSIYFPQIKSYSLTAIKSVVYKTMQGSQVHSHCDWQSERCFHSEQHPRCIHHQRNPDQKDRWRLLYHICDLCVRLLLL